MFSYFTSGKSAQSYKYKRTLQRSKQQVKSKFNQIHTTLMEPDIFTLTSVVRLVQSLTEQSISLGCCTGCQSLVYVQRILVQLYTRVIAKGI